MADSLMLTLYWQKTYLTSILSSLLCNQLLYQAWPLINTDLRSVWWHTHWFDVSFLVSRTLFLMNHLNKSTYHQNAWPLTSLVFLRFRVGTSGLGWREEHCVWERIRRRVKEKEKAATVTWNKRLKVLQAVVFFPLPGHLICFLGLKFFS